jgi:hypothetical protein
MTVFTAGSRLAARVAVDLADEDEDEEARDFELPGGERKACCPRHVLHCTRAMVVPTIARMVCASIILQRVQKASTSPPTLCVAIVSPGRPVGPPREGAGP